MNLKFRKEQDNRWFVILDDYPGPTADLEMVAGAGADALCDILSHNKDTLEVSLTDTLTPYTTVILHRWLPFEWEEGLEYIGVHYRVDFETGDLQSFDIWLCEVTTYLLGKYPSVIYIQYTN
jgi:hypothetical protein